MIGVSLYIVDDHPIIQESLKSFFDNEFENVICYSNGQELLAALKHSRPTHLIIDINMPLLSGVEVLETIQMNDWNINTTVFSMYNSSSLVKKCEIKGAKGYVLKTSTNKELMNAMVSIDFFVGEGIQLDNDISKASGSLTPREEEVLKYLAKDFNSKQIAQEMLVSEFTIATHRRNIKRKLGVETTSGLIRYAFESGIVGI